MQHCGIISILEKKGQVGLNSSRQQNKTLNTQRRVQLTRQRKEPRWIEFNSWMTPHHFPLSLGPTAWQVYFKCVWTKKAFYKLKSTLWNFIRHTANRSSKTPLTPHKAPQHQIARASPTEWVLCNRDVHNVHTFSIVFSLRNIWVHIVLRLNSETNAS